MQLQRFLASRCTSPRCCPTALAAAPLRVIVLCSAAGSVVPVSLETSSEQCADVCNSVRRTQISAQSIGCACRCSTGRRRGSTTYLARQLGGMLLNRLFECFTSTRTCVLSCSTVPSGTVGYWYSTGRSGR